MGDSTISFRDLDPKGDLEALRACIIELQEHERAIYGRLPPGTAVVDDCVSHMFEQCQECDGRIIVAEIDGEIGGFVTVLTRVISEDPDDGKLEYGLISDLVVLDAHRSRGIGRQLMELAEEHARHRDVEWLRVGVIAGNRGAQHLYGALGFEPWYQELEKRLVDE